MVTVGRLIAFVTGKLNINVLKWDMKKVVIAYKFLLWISGLYQVDTIYNKKILTIKSGLAFLEIPYVLIWALNGVYTSKWAFDAAIHDMLLKQISIPCQPHVMCQDVWHVHQADYTSLKQLYIYKYIQV